MQEDALVAIRNKHIKYKDDWIVDSGCSNHMTGDQAKLATLYEYQGDVLW